MPDVWLRLEARLAERKAAERLRAEPLDRQPSQEPSCSPPPEPSVTTPQAPTSELAHAPPQATQLPQPSVAPHPVPAQHRPSPRDEAAAFLGTYHSRSGPPLHREDAVPPVPPAAPPLEARRPPPPPPLPTSQRKVSFGDPGGSRQRMPYVPPCADDSDYGSDPCGSPMAGASDEDSDPMPESAKLKRPPGWTSAPPAGLSKQQKEAWKHQNVQTLLQFNHNYREINQAASQHAKAKRQKKQHAQHGHASTEGRFSQGYQVPYPPQSHRPRAAGTHAPPPDWDPRRSTQRGANAHAPARGHASRGRHARWTGPHVPPPSRTWQQPGQAATRAYAPAEAPRRNPEPSVWSGLYHRGDQGTSRTHGVRPPAAAPKPPAGHQRAYALPPVVPPGQLSRTFAQPKRPPDERQRPKSAARWRHTIYNRTLGDMVGPAAPLRPNTHAHCNTLPALPRRADAPPASTPLPHARTPVACPATDSNNPHLQA